MAYIYIKSGGTATGTAGKYDNAKTGSWSTAFSDVSEYYNDLYTALSNITAVEGDEIYVSDTHNFSTTQSGTRNYYATGCKILCVDNDDVSVLSTGASENVGVYSTNYYYLTGCYIYGIKIIGYGSTAWRGSNVSPTIFNNCIIGLTGSNSVFYYTQTFGYSTGPILIFKNCTMDFGASNWIYPNSILLSGGYVAFLNCTFTAYSKTTYAIFKDVTSSSYPTLAHCIGCDFSSADRPLFEGNTDPTGMTQVIFDKCNLGANNSRISLSLGRAGLQYPYTTYLSDPNPGAYLFQYYRYGTIKSTNSIYRNSGATINGTTPYSLEVVSGTITTTNPYGFRFKLVDLITDVSELKTFIIKIAQPNSSVLLKNSDVYIELLYPDDTNELSNFETTECYPLSTPSNYSYSTDVTWTGLSGPVLQEISINTTQLGKEGLCSIWVTIKASSKTIYFCPKIVIQ